MKVKWVLVLLNVLGIVGALAWLIIERSSEPIVTGIGLIGSLISLIYYNNGGESLKMKQKGGSGSTNYQIRGDININRKDD